MLSGVCLPNGCPNGRLCTPHAEFGPNDRRKDALHFIRVWWEHRKPNSDQYIEIIL